MIAQHLDPFDRLKAAIAGMIHCVSQNLTSEDRDAAEVEYRAASEAYLAWRKTVVEKP